MYQVTIVDHLSILCTITTDSFEHAFQISEFWGEFEGIYTTIRVEA